MSTSAVRARRYRERQDRGVLIVSLELTGDDVQGLIRLGMPDAPCLEREVIAAHAALILRHALKKNA